MATEKPTYEDLNHIAKLAASLLNSLDSIGLGDKIQGFLNALTLRQDLERYGYLFRLPNIGDQP